MSPFNFLWILKPLFLSLLLSLKWKLWGYGAENFEWDEALIPKPTWLRWKRAVNSSYIMCWAIFLQPQKQAREKPSQAHPHHFVFSQETGHSASGWMDCDRGQTNSLNTKKKNYLKWNSEKPP